VTTEARIADLERRLSLLEGGRHGATVTGWSAAARVLNVSSATVRHWFKTDAKFPKPSRIRTFKRNGEVRLKPEWRLSDLTLYRN